MATDPQVINNTMNNPDTLVVVWDKCNINFEAAYNDILALEAEGVDIECVDGGLVE
jgi:hypothetical protein